MFHFVCLNLLYDTNIYSGEEATMSKNIRWVYAALSAAAWIDACRGGSRLSAQSLWRSLVSSSLCPSPHLPAQPFTQTQSGLGEQQVCPTPLATSIRTAALWEIHATLPSPALIKAFLLSAGACGKSCCAWTAASYQPAQQESMEHHRGAHTRSPWLTAQGQHFKKSNIFLANIHSSAPDGKLGCVA